MALVGLILLLFVKIFDNVLLLHLNGDDDIIDYICNVVLLDKFI